MNAADTIMSDEDRYSLRMNINPIKTSTDDEYNNIILRTEREAQAEITWDIAHRVGFDEGVRKATEAGQDTLKGLLRAARKAGMEETQRRLHSPEVKEIAKEALNEQRKTGRREVAEIVSKHISMSKIDAIYWQGKLKEWGL